MGSTSAPWPQSRQSASARWVGFIAMILFEQYNSALTELHNDLKHFNETSSQFVKKESVQRYKEEMRECLKEMQASNSARTLLRSLASRMRRR